MGKAKRRKPQGIKPSPPDPYYQENPWDIIHDDRGRVIGEVYTLPSYLKSRGGKKGRKK